MILRADAGGEVNGQTVVVALVIRAIARSRRPRDPDVRTTRKKLDCLVTPLPLSPDALRLESVIDLVEAWFDGAFQVWYGALAIGCGIDQAHALPGLTRRRPMSRPDPKLADQIAALISDPSVPLEQVMARIDRVRGTPQKHYPEAEKLEAILYVLLSAKDDRELVEARETARRISALGPDEVEEMVRRWAL